MSLGLLQLVAVDGLAIYRVRVVHLRSRSIRGVLRVVFCVVSL